MTQTHRSEWALAHAGAARRVSRADVPTWDDVAAAYDAGIYHALAKTNAGQRRKLETYMRAMRVLNAHQTWAGEKP